MLFSYAVSLLGIAIILAPFSSMAMPLSHWLLMIVAGLTNVIGVYLFYYTIQRFEPSRVVPLFSLGSIFIVIGSALFLGEIFSLGTYLGIFLILFGSMVIASEDKLRYSFSNRLLWLMCFSGLAFSIETVILKYLTGFYAFWDVFAIFAVCTAFWAVVFFTAGYKFHGRVLIGIKIRIMIFSVINELISTSATFLYVVALSVWYASLVETFSAFQFVFIFFWGVLIYRYKPAIYHEDYKRKMLVQKAISVILIIVGVFLVTK